MKKLKVCFVDFWDKFNPENNFFSNFLKESYDIELSDQPDYCFFSVYGYENLKYSNCIKIQFIGENQVPDFNLCDYALGFQHMSFEDRYFRFPLFFIYGGYENLKNKRIIYPEKLLNRKFCNFVYSNHLYANPLREVFFKELSKYKIIDSGGKHLNNIGYKVNDKVEFIRDYKFTIAFESSVLSGYTTEKIYEPMLVNSIPIYYGNPLVDKDFNKDSFLWLKSESDIDKVIERVIELDKDDNKYLEMVTCPCLTQVQSILDWKGNLKLFFDSIFEKELSDARRLPQFGYNSFFQNELSRIIKIKEKQRKINKVKLKLNNIYETIFSAFKKE